MATRRGGSRPFLSCEEYRPDDLVDQVRRAEEAGFDELHVAPVGPYHAEMIEFYRKEILPRV